MAGFQSKVSHVLVHSIIYLYSIGVDRVPSHVLLRVIGVVSLGPKVQID